MKNARETIEALDIEISRCMSQLDYFMGMKIENKESLESISEEAVTDQNANTTASGTAPDSHS